MSASRFRLHDNTMRFVVLWVDSVSPLKVSKEVAFKTDLREVVIALGFPDEIVNWFPISCDDGSLIRSFRDCEIDLPIGFARSGLAFVFRKPRSVRDADAALE